MTCLGAAHAMLARTTFDLCIVDEATQVNLTSTVTLCSLNKANLFYFNQCIHYFILQVLQCTVLRPLFAANRFVLVGDPEQLPPVVRSRAARYGDNSYYCIF